MFAFTKSCLAAPGDPGAGVQARREPVLLAVREEAGTAAVLAG